MGQFRISNIYKYFIKLIEIPKIDIYTMKSCFLVTNPISRNTRYSQFYDS